MIANKTHPNDALFGGEKQFPLIPTCEHFAGSEKLILKALGLQDANIKYRTRRVWIINVLEAKCF